MCPSNSSHRCSGFHSLLFLALGAWECEAAQARNEMHQMETIWKEHPTLTLRATWKRTFSQQKAPSHRQTAPSHNIPGSWEPSASKELSTEPPALDAPKVGCPSAPCQGTVSWRGGRGAEQGRKALGGNGEADSQVGHGRNKSIIQPLSSGKAGGDPEEVPALITKLQGTALSAGVLEFPRHSPRPVLPISIQEQPILCISRLTSA